MIRIESTVRFRFYKFSVWRARITSQLGKDLEYEDALTNFSLAFSVEGFTEGYNHTAFCKFVFFKIKSLLKVILDFKMVI